MKNAKKKITEEPNFITLEEGKTAVIFTNKDAVLYQIDINDLSEITIVKDIHFSKCIWDLSGNTWASVELCYRLGSVIARRFPDNTIDWQGMFLVFEEAIMIKELYEKERSPEIKIPDESGFQVDIPFSSQVINFMNFSAGLDRSYFDPIIQAKVIEMLREYSIK